MANRNIRRLAAQRTWRAAQRARHTPTTPDVTETPNAAEIIARLCHEAIEAKRARLASLAARACCVAAHPYATDGEVMTYAAIAEQYDREQIEQARRDR